MTRSKEVVISRSAVSKSTIIALAAIFVFGMFVVGYDQGQILSIVFGDQAYIDMYIHELTHDMRHAAGFPCH